MYKLSPIVFGNTQPTSVIRFSDGACIPFSLANTDFQQFKLDLADGVELQDADGNTMTAEEVAEFVATLP